MMLLTKEISYLNLNKDYFVRLRVLNGLRRKDKVFNEGDKPNLNIHFESETNVSLSSVFESVTRSHQKSFPKY